MTGYAVGWNRLGYLPPEPPSVYATFSEARDAMTDVLRDLLDVHPLSDEATEAADDLRYATGVDSWSGVVGVVHYWIEPVEDV